MKEAPHYIHEICILPDGLSSVLLPSGDLYRPDSSFMLHPDGSIAQDLPNNSIDIACSNTAGASVCCGVGYACLSKCLCMRSSITNDLDVDLLYIRGSCRDETWNSSGCPAFCVDPRYGMLVSQAMPLTPLTDIVGEIAPQVDRV